jgi:hypothetical protein
MFTYKYLDHLPKVPNHLLEDFDSAKTDNDLVMEIMNLTLETKDTSIKMVNYRRFHAEGELLDWLRSNIVDEALDISLSFHNITDDVETQYPHIDRTRYYTLMYFTDLGGNDVVTSFYQEQGGPLVRPEIRLPSPEIALIYDKLELVDSVKFEKNRWVILNSKIIHGIENMQRCRKSIQVSLDKINKFI